jgi:hypothetical protein
MTNMKEGHLVVLPGLPAFYDYEWYPQPVDVREMPRYNKRCIHWNGRFQHYKELPSSFYDVFKAGAE